MKSQRRTVEIWNRIVETLSTWIDTLLNNPSMELLILLFDQMHRFAVGNAPERGTNYWSTEVPKTCAWTINNQVAEV